MKKIKIIRTSTKPDSLKLHLRGQLRMLSKKYEVIGVSSNEPELFDIEKNEGVRVHPINMDRHIKIYRDIISLYKLIKFFKKEKPDIVHSINPKAGLLSMIAAKIAKVPIRIHTFTGLIFPTSNGIKKKILIMTDKLTCLFATNVFPEGFGVKKDLEDNKITKKTLKVIGNGNVNGIDIKYFQSENILLTKNQLRELNSISDNSIVFCFIGRVIKDKGIYELIDAFKRLIKESFDVKLIILGHFEENLYPIDKEIKEYIINSKEVLFFGFQNDIRPYLKISDIFVLPSYREGFPNTVLQAGAMNLPCIVTNVNGSNEIIKDGNNGFIVPSKNVSELFQKMKSFVLNPSLISILSKNARTNIINKYTNEIIWKELGLEYEKYLLKIKK